MADGTTSAANAIISSILGSAEDCAVREVVDRFNGMYCVVNEGGKAVVFQQGFDPVLKRRRLDRLSPADLRLLYLNERIQVGVNKDGSPAMKGVADVWLHHAERRQFIHGVTFDPARQVRLGVLNLWEGYAVTPAPGDWSLMRGHIQHVVCDGDPTRFRYTMGWTARMLQYPNEQGEVAMVMKGAEGTGKGTFAKAIKTIVGHHALAIANGKHLVGNFNSHLRDVVFLFADEAFFAGDRAHVGVLKSIITEPYLTVEAKYANAIEVPNYLHLMMASNEEWVVPASLEARRFFVNELSADRRNDHAYFAAIWEQMEAGGYAAMLHDLLAYDLTGFNVRNVPVTEGLQRQRKLSLGTTEAWWLDCLERGYVFRSRLGLESVFAKWRERVSTELLFASYTDFANARRERRQLTREGLGRFVTSMRGEATRIRNAIVGEHLTEEANLHGGISRKAKPVRQDRACGYDVGSIETARQGFSAVTGLQVDWDGGAATEDADGDE
jgi:hypothetical protein